MLNVYSSIQSLYPDIQGELENRHSAVYSRIKTRFQKLYGGLQPQYFVNAKGIAPIIGVVGTPLSLQLALQNGVVLAVCRTYPGEPIYINGQEKEQVQVQLDCRGNVLEGDMCQLAKWAKQGMRAAFIGRQINNKKSLFGGVIYIRREIPIDSFECSEAMITAICLAIILINRWHLSYPFSKVIQNIGKITNSLPKLSLFQNYQFQLMQSYSNFITSNKTLQLLPPKQIKILPSHSWKLFLTDISKFSITSTQAKKIQLKKKHLQIQQRLGQILLCQFFSIEFQFFPFDNLLHTLSGNLEKLKDLIMSSLKDSYSYTQILQHISLLNWPQAHKIINWWSSLIIHQQNIIHLQWNPRQKLLIALQQFNILKKLEQHTHHNSKFNNHHNYLTQKSLATSINSSYQFLKQQGLVPNSVDNLIKYCLKHGAIACGIINSSKSLESNHLKHYNWQFSNLNKNLKQQQDYLNNNNSIRRFLIVMCDKNQILRVLNLVRSKIFKPRSQSNGSGTIPSFSSFNSSSEAKQNYPPQKLIGSNLLLPVNNNNNNSQTSNMKVRLSQQIEQIIHTMIFSSLPSKGVGILDAKNQIWY